MRSSHVAGGGSSVSICANALRALQCTATVSVLTLGSVGSRLVGWCGGRDVRALADAATWAGGLQRELDFAHLRDEQPLTKLGKAAKTKEGRLRGFMCVVGFSFQHTDEYLSELDSLWS